MLNRPSQYRIMCLQETGEEALVASSVKDEGDAIDRVMDAHREQHPEHHSYWVEAVGQSEDRYDGDY